MRSTPCVGICSTTYGDLVCRGCKRFSHEIVAWNVYNDDQRLRIWHRLYGLRDQATAVFVAVSDEQRLRDAGSAARLEFRSESSLLTLSYEVLRRRARDLHSLDAIGLVALDGYRVEPVAVRDAIDAEFHIRSVAYFEHSFHTPVDS
jgi:predicted Fe-S protein YdhL (DUF1289 family)